MPLLVLVCSTRDVNVLLDSPRERYLVAYHMRFRCVCDSQNENEARSSCPQLQEASFEISAGEMRYCRLVLTANANFVGRAYCSRSRGYTRRALSTYLSRRMMVHYSACRILHLPYLRTCRKVLADIRCYLTVRYMYARALDRFSFHTSGQQEAHVGR